MTIYEIKELSKITSPYFFSKDTLRFFGKTLRSFKVYKQKDGMFLVIAKNKYGVTKRIFHPLTNKLEQVN